MPDIICCEQLTVDQPHQLLYDPAPTANLPSGVFVKVPIEADEPLWRHDALGLAGRIQQDVPGQRLVITEDGLYSGACVLRINQVGFLSSPPGSNPFRYDLELRVNGSPVRRWSRMAPDGWDLNATSGGGNSGIVAQGWFVIPLQAADVVELYVRFSAFLGGSFVRNTQQQYGTIELSKVAEVKAVETTKHDQDCGDEQLAVCVPMQATAAHMIANAGFGAANERRFEPPFVAEYSEIINEGGDGAGGSIASWGGGGFTAPFRYAAEGGRELIAIFRGGHEMRYSQVPAPPQHIPGGDIRWESNQVLSLSRSRFQRRVRAGEPVVIGEGIEANFEATGGSVWMNANANDSGLQLVANRFIGVSTLYGPRATVSAIVIEVLP